MMKPPTSTAVLFTVTACARPPMWLRSSSTVIAKRLSFESSYAAASPESPAPIMITEVFGIGASSI